MFPQPPAKVFAILAVTFASLVAASLTMSLPAKPVFAASCSGSGCNDTNPNSTGCDASGVTTVAYEYPASSYIELRQSSICNTQWAKTTNTDGPNRYFFLNATLKNHYYTASAYSLPVGAYVYSHQRYGTSYKACGYASFNYIGGLVSSPCTP